ncbi:MAG TPA: hypothetical protein VFE47_29545 [Tepidisphaeraceae bacterium]|nr:hypothetical protein [Tepidisphaeraceae bacterium]
MEYAIPPVQPVRRVFRPFAQLLSFLARRWRIVVPCLVLAGFSWWWTDQIVTLRDRKAMVKPALQTYPLTVNGVALITEIDLSKSLFRSEVGTYVSCNATRLRLNGIDVDPTNLKACMSHSRRSIGGGGTAAIIPLKLVPIGAPSGPVRLECHLTVKVSGPTKLGFWYSTDEFPVDVSTMVVLPPGTIPMPATSGGNPR